MQYVQRLSQPSCTFIWTRVRDSNLALTEAGKVASCSVKGRDGLSGCGSSSVGSMAREPSLPICCICCICWVYRVSSGSMGREGLGVGDGGPAKDPPTMGA